LAIAVTAVVAVLLVIVAAVPAEVVLAVLLVDIVDVDGDTPIAASADSRTHNRCIASSPDHGQRRHLRDEDGVVFAVGRHRMRPGRLRDGLDQDARSVDDAQHGAADRPARAGIIAVVADIEPHLIGTGYAANVRIIFGYRVDHQRGRVARVVLRGTAQQQVRIWSDRGAVGSTGVQRDNSGIRGRIERAQDRRRLAEGRRVDDQQPAVAGNGALQLTVLQPAGLLAMIGIEV